MALNMRLFRALAFLVISGFEWEVHSLSQMPAYGTSVDVPFIWLIPLLFCFVSISSRPLWFPSQNGWAVGCLSVIRPVFSWFVINYLVPISQLQAWFDSVDLGMIAGAILVVFLSFPLIVSIACIRDHRRKSSQSWTEFLCISPLALGIIWTTRQISRTGLPQHIGKHFLLTRATLQMCTATAYCLLQPSKHQIGFVITGLVFFLAINPHTHLPHALPIANGILNAHGYSLLERHESLTGYLSVLQNDKDQYRVLRCDHSLLGGNWIPTTARKGQGITVPEPVFEVFVMLEAVRLMQHDDEPPDKPLAALVV